MSNVIVDADQCSDQPQDPADDVSELGRVSEMTHGAQFGWKIEAGIYPYYF